MSTHTRAVLLLAMALMLVIVTLPAVAARFASNTGLLIMLRSAISNAGRPGSAPSSPDLDLSVGWFRTAAQLDPSNRGAWRGLAIIASLRGGSASVADDFRAAGMTAEELIWRGSVAESHEDWSSALQWYTWAGDLAPSNGDAHVLQALMLERLAQPLKALEHYLTALDSANFSSTAVEQRARYRAKLLINARAPIDSIRNASDRLHLYRRAVEHFPYDAYLRAGLGRSIYEATGRVVEAESELRLAMRLNPDISLPYLILADLLLQENRSEEALEAAQIARAHSSPNVEVWVYIGRAYTLQEDFNEARSAFETAIRIDARSARAHFWLGQIDYAEQKFAASVERFRTATELGPHEFRNWYWLGEALQITGDVAGARQAYTNAQLIDPAHPAPAKRLAELAGSH